MSVRTAAARPTTAQAFPWLGLFILAGAIFVCVTSEFLPTGLLPELAEGLGVAEFQVGFLVTVYAGTVVVSAPLLTTLTRRFPRKQLVIVVLIVFAITNVIVAIAPNFATVVVARIAGGLALGLFWAVVGAYGAHLVSKELLPRAVAITSAGATTAFVLGVPIGTTLGHALGWRLSFVVMAVAIAVLLVLVVFFLPPVRHEVDLRTGEIAIPTRKDPTVVPVVVICAIVSVAIVAQNVFYTYIVPYYRELVGFGNDQVSIMLFAYGAAGVVSLVLVGLFASRYPRAGLPVALSVAAIAVLVVGIAPQQTPLVVVAVIVWGVAFGCGPVLFQTRLLQVASPRIRDIASAWLTVAFNIGIGGGAFIGGLLFNGVGLEVLPFVEVGVLVLAIVLLLASLAWTRRVARSADRAAESAPGPQRPADGQEQHARAAGESGGI